MPSMADVIIHVHGFVFVDVAGRHLDYESVTTKHEVNDTFGS